MGVIFKILEAPVVSTEGKKILSLVFIDHGSNTNFINHELAGQLQLEDTLNKIFIKRVAKEYTKREVKVCRLGVEGAKKQVHWMEAVEVGSITESVPLKNKDKIRRDFQEILEEAARRPEGAAGLLISMMERQLHTRGGIEKGMLRLSQTPLGCKQVLKGMAPRGEKGQEGDEVSVECQELQAATTVCLIRGSSFHVSARANTPDAKEVKARKKPRGSSNQDIHGQITVRASDRRGRKEQDTYKRPNTGTPVQPGQGRTKKARIPNSPRGRRT